MYVKPDHRASLKSFIFCIFSCVMTFFIISSGVSGLWLEGWGQGWGWGWGKTCRMLWSRLYNNTNGNSAQIWVLQKKHDITKRKWSERESVSAAPLLPTRRLCFLFSDIHNWCDALYDCVCVPFYSYHPLQECNKLSHANTLTEYALFLES